MTDELKNSITKAVKHSVKKYRKTYIALEKYDTGKKRKPEFMADNADLRPYFRSV